MEKERVRIGQVYKSIKNNMFIEIAGKKDSKWLAKVLTAKKGVYNGSHRMAEMTLKKHFELLK